MTNLQRLELRASELRQKLNDLSALAELNDEQRGDIDKLANEYSDVERQKRAAILAGDTPEITEPQDGDGETREITSLLERAEIRSFLTSAASGNPVTGAERELRQAILGDDVDESYMPIDILTPLETRADAVTNVADSIQHNQQNIIGRLFRNTAGAYMGVQRPSVPVGETHYYTLTGGATADFRSDGVAKDAEAATFATKSVEPIRLTARYLFGIETTARIRGFEEALRADIRAVLGDKLDLVASRGQAAVTDVSPVIEGLVTSYAQSGSDETSTWLDYLNMYPAHVGGKVSDDGSNVRALVNVATFQKAYSIQIPTSGEMLMDRLPAGRFKASANMPLKNGELAYALTYAETSRTTYVQPVWRGIQLIRDVYTEAAKGQVSLTAIMLTGAAMVNKSHHKLVVLNIS